LKKLCQLVLRPDFLATQCSISAQQITTTINIHAVLLGLQISADGQIRIITGDRVLPSTKTFQKNSSISSPISIYILQKIQQIN